MARTLAPGELWKKTTLMRLIREASGTHGNTTTTAAVLGTGVETAVAVTAITNFVSADECLIIGSGGVEATKIGTPATSMPVSPPPKIPQLIGARFVEAEVVDLGKYAADSIQLTMNKALTAVFEEIGDTSVVYIPGNAEFGLGFALLSISGLNMQTIMGYADAETGDGLAEATAFQAALGLPNQTTLGELVFRVQGLRHDLKTIEIDFCNAYFEASVSATLGKSSPTQLAGSVKSSAIIVRQWT